MSTDASSEEMTERSISIRTLEEDGIVIYPGESIAFIVLDAEMETSE